MEQQEVKLTQYSHGAGCGCKIAPGVLDQILGQLGVQADDPKLIVGHGARDDAAVYDLGDGTAAVSTTDFFMPIVDDPHTFGRIAAANAISDIYAMGGTPLMAIAILGWPVDKLSPEVAGQVLEGGRSVCAEAGIPLAGGHSIDSPEPIFGLAVTGRVEIAKLKKNGGALAGDRLYLTKPLGVGMVTTAQKKGLVEAPHLDAASRNMTQLNKVGAALGQIDGVHAMTDVTGFGLAGHGLEMARATGVELVVDGAQLPTLDRSALEGIMQRAAFPEARGAILRATAKTSSSKVLRISFGTSCVIPKPAVVCSFQPLRIRWVTLRPYSSNSVCMPSPSAQWSPVRATSGCGADTSGSDHLSLETWPKSAGSGSHPTLEDRDVRQCPCQQKAQRGPFPEHAV